MQLILSSGAGDRCKAQAKGQQTLSRVQSLAWLESLMPHAPSTLQTMCRRNLKTKVLRSENASNVFRQKTPAGKFKHVTITGHVGFVFEENSVREIT